MTRDNMIMMVEIALGGPCPSVVAVIDAYTESATADLRARLAEALSWALDAAGSNPASKDPVSR